MQLTFVSDFTMPESFKKCRWQKRHATLPESGESVVGGHAVVGAGDDDNLQCFIVRKLVRQ
jgi:hypothetical protein